MSDIINNGIIRDINIHSSGKSISLSYAIEVIHCDYKPCEKAEEAKLAFTTKALNSQIRAFFGIEASEADVAKELMDRGYKAVYAEIIELGLRADYYWILK